MSVDQALAIGVSSSWRRLAASRSTGLVGGAGEVGGDRGGEADGPRRLDLGLHQHQRAAHVRMVEEPRRIGAGPGRAALLALQRVGQRLLVGPLGDGDALHADLQPRGVHHHEHRRQARRWARRPARPWRPRNSMTQVGEAWMPSLCSIEPQAQRRWPRRASRPRSPAASARGTARCRAMPGGASGRRASTRWTMLSAMSWSPQVMKIFWPVSRQPPSPSRLGRVVSAPRSRAGLRLGEVHRAGPLAGDQLRQVERLLARVAVLRRSPRSRPGSASGRGRKPMLAAWMISKTAISSALGRPWPPNSGSAARLFQPPAANCR